MSMVASSVVRPADNARQPAFSVEFGQLSPRRWIHERPFPLRVHTYRFKRLRWLERSFEAVVVTGSWTTF